MNPFKLLGSYIGLLLGFVGAYFSFAVVFALCEQAPCSMAVLLIPAGVIIAGFLAGWGVHELVVYLRNG